ncbi:MAG TPA: methylmalonyl-CoA mutase family protein [Xanthobacteraceae bacterium]|nr:methylmalonyl-CoA mutase family protein [Xanthobacteraceae bacterium]
MTEAPADILPLAADFPPARREQWLELVGRLLKGAPFDRTLAARTYDGLAIQPLYERAAARPMPAGRIAGAGWEILQRIDHPEAAAANAEALHDRHNGATGLSLVTAGSIGAYGYGAAAGADAIARTLDGIPLDAADTTLELDSGAWAEAAGRSLASLLSRRGGQAGTARIRFGFDPLGTMATSGAAPTGWSETATQFGGSIAELASAGFKGPFAVADGRAIHNAGGSETQELGFALAVAAAYLRALAGCGIGLDAARRMIFFRLTADADQFLSIAKFRALRRLWGRVEDACGLAAAPVFITAETAWRMMTKRDPYVNMLRATIAVFSAGVGGTDAITVLPFTLARGLPDRFARRAARNTQLVLSAESHLSKVSDAAAGAGIFEDLTDQLCNSAWALFQEIEKAGGAAAALEQGLIQKKVATVRAARQAALARRTDMLTGTSDFADLDEPAVAVLEVAPLAPLPPAQITLEALPRIRLAEPFEHLRDTSDRILAQTRARPKVFLANLGVPADFTPRANFARNFFAAGGIAAVTNEGFAPSSPPAAEAKTDLAALVAACKDAGAGLVCLCGSDETYRREAVAAAEALTAAGAPPLYYAGRPAVDATAALAAAGIATFIHAGCDALAVLQAAQEQIASRQP